MHDEFSDWRTARLLTLAGALALALMFLFTSGCASGTARHGVRTSVTVSGPVGYVRTLPPGTRAVVVGGHQYRVYKGTYYRWDAGRRVWVIRR